MTKNENEKNRICRICGEIFSDPVNLSSCGHTFDRHCLVDYVYCPLPTCRTIISKDFRTKDEKPIFELFLLDTSSSMWFSDSFLGLFGRGRFDMAIEFLRVVFNDRFSSSNKKVSLVTFDDRPVERFPFEQIRHEHLEILSKLKPNGSQTSIFDGIRFCLEKFQKIHSNFLQNLYILTDGGDDFSSSGTQRHYIEYLQKKMGKSVINAQIIHIGDKNMRSTNVLCQRINYNYQHFNQNDINLFLRSFSLLNERHVQNFQQENFHFSSAPSAPIQTNDRNDTLIKE